jgi:hypothetical protein
MSEARPFSYLVTENVPFRTFLTFMRGKAPVESRDGLALYPQTKRGRQIITGHGLVTGNSQPINDQIPWQPLLLVSLKESL